MCLLLFRSLARRRWRLSMARICLGSLGSRPQCVRHGSGVAGLDGGVVHVVQQWAWDARPRLWIGHVPRRGPTSAPTGCSLACGELACACTLGFPWRLPAWLPVASTSPAFLLGDLAVRGGRAHLLAPLAGGLDASRGAPHRRVRRGPNAGSDVSGQLPPDSHAVAGGGSGHVETAASPAHAPIIAHELDFWGGCRSALAPPTIDLASRPLLASASLPRCRHCWAVARAPTPGATNAARPSSTPSRRGTLRWPGARCAVIFGGGPRRRAPSPSLSPPPTSSSCSSSPLLLLLLRLHALLLLLHLCLLCILPLSYPLTSFSVSPSSYSCNSWAANGTCWSSPNSQG